jgi:hypothetical protein
MQYTPFHLPALSSIHTGTYSTGICVYMYMYMYMDERACRKLVKHVLKILVIRDHYSPIFEHLDLKNERRLLVVELSIGDHRVFIA